MKAKNENIESVPFKKIPLSSLILDDRNANVGTDTGKELLKTSVAKYGAGRGILIDKDLHVIAGNHVVAEMLAQGYTDIVIIETTGQQLVATQRTDIELNSKAGRELALADNRVAQANISFDFDVIGELFNDFDLDLSDIGIDLMQGGPTFQEDVDNPDESEQMETDGGRAGGNGEYQANAFPIGVALNKMQKFNWDKIKKSLKETSDTAAFLILMKHFEETFEG